MCVCACVCVKLSGASFREERPREFTTDSSAMILISHRTLAAENHISGAINELQCLAYPSKPLIIACERGGIDWECIEFPCTMLAILPRCEPPD